MSLVEQTRPVDEVEPLPRLGIRQPVGPMARTSLLGDPGAGRSGTDDDDLLITDRAVGLAQPGQHRGHGHRGRALDVVVERAQVVAVAIEQEMGVVLGEVLPLQHHVREDLLHGLDERVDEGVVVRPDDPLVPPAEVVGVVAARLVVRADVEHDRQCGGRVDAAARRVQRQLADRDPETVRALVAQTEDALTVGDDDHGDLVVGDRPQHLLEPVGVGIRQEQPTMVLVDHAELLARLADHRRVHDRHQRRDVVEQQAQEQRLVVVLHVAQQHVSLEIGLEQGVLRPDAGGALLDRLDVGRQESVQTRARRARRS